MTKHDVRKHCERIRSAVPPEEKRILDRLIERNLLAWEIFQRAETVLCYVSFRSEISTERIMERAIEAGKHVAVPRIDNASSRMRFFFLNRSGRFDLENGAYGIPEPAQSCEEVDYRDIDIVIAPGLAFTMKGDRLGYGGGYYDRFLHANPDLLRCALTYDRLILDFLPVKNNDVPVDYLISETGVKTTEAGKDGERDRTPA